MYEQIIFPILDVSKPRQTIYCNVLGIELRTGSLILIQFVPVSYVDTCTYKYNTYTYIPSMANRFLGL